MKKIYHFYGVTPQIYGIKKDGNFITANPLHAHFWHHTLDSLVEKHGYKCEVHLLTTNKYRKNLKLGRLQIIFNPTIRLPLFKKVNHRVSIAFLNYLEKNRPDLFVFYGGLSFLSLLYVTFLLKWNIPYIVQHHGAPIGFNPSQKFIYRKAKAVIALTQFAKEKIAQKHKVSLLRLAVIPCGINLKVYYPESLDSKSYPILCFVGRFTRMKGFLDVLQCLRYIKNIFPDAMLETAGDYINEDYQKEMDAFIRKYNLMSSIIFHGWVNQPEKLREIYNRADLLIFPSRSEGLPRVVLESMACGTPVVTLRTLPGCCEVIEDQKNGVLTDLINLNQSTSNILSNREKLKKMSVCDRETIIKKYSFEASCIKAERLYKNLIEE